MSGEPAKALSVTVTYRLSDIYGALFHSWRRFVRLLVIVEMLWIVLSLGMDLFDGVKVAQAVWWLPWKLLLIGGLVLVVFWFSFVPLLGFARMNRAGVLGPNRMSLTDRGLRLETSKSDSVAYWPAIRRLVTTSGRLYLFFVPAGAVIVPRRAFSSNAEFDSFVATAKSRWEKGKAK